MDKQQVFLLRHSHLLEVLQTFLEGLVILSPSNSLVNNNLLQLIPVVSLTYLVEVLFPNLILSIK